MLKEDEQRKELNIKEKNIYKLRADKYEKMALEAHKAALKQLKDLWNDVRDLRANEYSEILNKIDKNKVKQSIYAPYFLDHGNKDETQVLAEEIHRAWKSMLVCQSISYLLTGLPDRDYDGEEMSEEEKESDWLPAMVALGLLTEDDYRQENYSGEDLVEDLKSMRSALKESAECFPVRKFCQDFDRF